MLALSVAGVLAVFLVYVSLAGGGTPAIAPGELAGRTKPVVLTGQVVGAPRQVGDNVWAFTLRDVEGTATVRVRYAASLPDQFKDGRDLSLEGQLRNGVFVGKPGTMVTKCPSKYEPKKNSS